MRWLLQAAQEQIEFNGDHRDGLTSSEKAALIIAFLVIALILGLIVAMMSRVLRRVETLETEMRALQKRLTESSVFDEKD